MSSKTNASKALWVLVFSQLIIGGTYCVVKFGLQEFTPFALGTLRFILTAVVFSLVLFLRKGKKVPQPQDYGVFLLLGALAVPLNQGLFLSGMKYTFAAHGALIYAGTPIVILVLSSIWLKEKPTFLKLVGVFWGFVGVLFLLFDKGIHFSSHTVKGDFLILLAVIVWGVYSIISKQILSRYSPLEVTAFSLIIGAVLFLPIGIPALINLDYTRITSVGIFSVLYLAILTSVYGYLIWVWAISYLDTTKAAIVVNLQPPIAAFLGWFFLGETISYRFIIGALIIFTGVIFTQKG